LSSAVRKFAVRLLSTVTRNSQLESRGWGNAMLRELDFIDSDWASLWWALGGTTAVLKHSLSIAARSWVRNQIDHRGKWSLKNVGKKVARLASGVAISAALLAVSIVGVARLLSAVLSARTLEHLHWLGWLPILVIPEGIFAIAAIALWRKRRDIASGIVLGAVALGVHVVVHVTTHK